MKKIWLLILLGVTACTTNSARISILAQSSCSLPCWNNIKVGQTTRDEILHFIEMSTDIDQQSIQIDKRPWKIFDTYVFFSFDRGSLLDRHPERQVDVHILNNIVSDMVICGELNTTIDDIVHQIGEPEFIISGDDLDGNRNVILIDSTVGVSYWYTTDSNLGKSQYEINPETEIQCLNLFDPTLYKEMMEVGLFSMGHYTAEQTLRVIYPWDGYGNVDEKYPPRQP